MAGTKDKILDILKRDQKHTVSELAELLQMTGVGVRKHLSTLEKSGLIGVEELRKPVGRPVRLFSLTEKADASFPKNYENIAVQFLEDIEDLYGEESVKRLFEKRKSRLYQVYSPAITGKKSNEDKAGALEQLQNEHGYMCRLNKISDGVFELVEYNCPIFAVANQFKFACNRETDLMKGVLGAESVERIMCRTDGDAHCRFLIKFHNDRNR